MKVLITGGMGRMGPYLVAPFKDKYDLLTFDLPGKGADFEGDLSSLEPLQTAMRGCDVVVHLAAISDEAPFVEKLVGPNVIGVYNVLEAARLEKVRRVVFASTVQTVGRAFQDGITNLETDSLPRPSTMYGATKVMGETMGRYFHDHHGLEFVALRIGAFQDYDSQMLRENRAWNVWLSPRDAATIFSLAIEKQGIGYAIVNATSKNHRTQLSQQSAFEILGYEPADDAEAYYAPRPIRQLARKIKHKVLSKFRSLSK